MLDAARDAGNRWIFHDQLVDGLEPWGGVKAVWAFGSPEATHGVDTTETFDAGVASLAAHAAYIEGLGWENWDPREFLEGFGRQVGQWMGVPFATSAEVYSLTWGGDDRGGDPGQQRNPTADVRRWGSACSPGWTRTNNPPVNSRMLCQLSYRGSKRAQVSKVRRPARNRRARSGRPRPARSPARSRRPAGRWGRRGRCRRRTRRSSAAHGRRSGSVGR